MLPFQQGDVPARFDPATGLLDNGELTRRTCWATRCSTAGATPVPSAAAAQAAVWLGKTLFLSSGMPRLASIWPVSLPGSVPDGSTSHSHWRAAPRPGMPGGHHDEPVPEDRLGHQGESRIVGNGRADRHVGEAVGDQYAISLVTATPAIPRPCPQSAG